MLHRLIKFRLEHCQLVLRNRRDCFEEDNKGATSGSRVQFIKDEHTILLHKPHPGNQLKPYQVKNVVIELRNLKLI